MADWKKYLWTYICIYILHLFQEVRLLDCFRCPLSQNHSDCHLNSTTEECHVGTRTCSIQTRYRAGTREVIQVTRSCMVDTFCLDEIERSGNKDCQINQTSHYVCVTCCHTDFCNQLPSSSTEGAGYKLATVSMGVAIALASVFSPGQFLMPDS